MTTTKQFSALLLVSFLSACSSDGTSDITCTDEELWDHVAQQCVPRYRDSTPQDTGVTPDAAPDAGGVDEADADALRDVVEQTHAADGRRRQDRAAAAGRSDARARAGPRADGASSVRGTRTSTRTVVVDGRQLSMQRPFAIFVDVHAPADQVWIQTAPGIGHHRHVGCALQDQ